MIPLTLYKHRLIVLANSASLTAGVILIGVTSFLPAFVQGVMGYSAVVAGFTLTTLSIGWPIASTTAGRLFLKVGYAKTALAGGVALFLGALCFLLLGPARGPVWAGAASFMIGVGMGLVNTTFIVSIQNSVDWKTRGIATASNMFMRILGSAVGAALLGGILNTSLQKYLQSHELSSGRQLSLNAANLLLNDGGGHFSQQTKQLLQDGLTVALHHVYLGVFVFACLTLFLTALLPKNRDLSS